MLTLTKLASAEYPLEAVARGLEDYYMGIGEAPGVWRGRWAESLRLEGVVEAEDLRALVKGLDPATGADLLAGHRERKVRAIDVTLSCPKSVSLLWAFGTPATSATVSISVVEATEVALKFLEERAALARVQEGGLRRRVPTDGFAIATFAHRTSRAGDPQLHTHCIIPNMVRRADGTYVAFDANPMHIWAKATGTVFLNELERNLTTTLGVAWGPERNGSRELVRFSRDQLRAFSKRTVAIETHLEAAGELAFGSKAERMRADDRASLATRERKDKTLTPERLRDRWAAEATAIGLHPGPRVDDLVIGRQLDRVGSPTAAEVFAALVDPATGLCATESRFGEAHVVERVAAISGGRLSVDEIVGMSQRFLSSELVVRLAPGADRRRPPEWSTVEHRAVEDRLLADLHHLVSTPRQRVDRTVVTAAIDAEPKLGRDQAAAVAVLCGAGPSVRALVAPAGFGKTTALRAAATAQLDAGRRVVALAPTHKAVAELRAAGLDAQTIARFLIQLEGAVLGPNTTVIIDEVSLLGTRDAAALIDAVAHSRGAQLWCVGDVRQSQSVAAGGLAVELERLAHDGAIPAATLRHNRRQVDPADRHALAKLRSGEVDASREIRTARGWEHEADTPVQTRQALAETALSDADRHGAETVAVLAVGHADCEDLADRIRAIRAARGELRGPTIEGPGWGPEPRVYAAGDRVLIHANRRGEPHVFNGAVGTVLGISSDGADVLLDGSQQVFLSAALIVGHRPDGTPNLSHAWARTVAGAQGGTWAQVHLLGTPALDAFTGYVGQSRGRQPTHTWNTRPEADHPARLLADDRSAGRAVADAMGRAEPKTFAAVDDPWVLDRRLRTERHEHAAVVARRPADRSDEAERTRDRVARATEEHRQATRALAQRRAERDGLGPLRRLRRGGRDDIAHADQLLAGAQRRLERASSALDGGRDRLACYETAVATRSARDDTHGWRLERMAEIDRTLAHHWADVALRAVRADDPLAFGVEVLRAARATYRADLATIVAALPADRHDAVAAAEANLRHHETNLRYAERRVAQASAALDQADERHWGRRDRSGIARASPEVHAAETDLSRSGDAVAQARERVIGERRAVDTWTAAVNATAEQRGELAAAVKDATAALDHTRPERVVAAALDPANELWDVLGPPPATRGGLAAWCGIAERVEGWNDSHPATGPRPGLHGAREGNDLASLLAEAPDIIEIAGRLDPMPACQPVIDRATWHAAVEAAGRGLAAARPVIDHDLGLEL